MSHDEAYARARGSHPDLELSRAAFLAHLGRLPEPERSRVRAADLYLALACANGDPAALARFDAQVTPKVAQALARFEPAVDADDLLQKLRQRLLLPRGARRPRIAGYSGLGPLTSWTRAIAVRLALRVTRGRRAEPPADDEMLEQLVANDDPELGLLRGQYRVAFRAAFREAFASLASKDRNVLRLHLLDGLSVDRIGALYGVHRGSAWRWLDQLRARLDAATRERLAAGAGLQPSEIDHLLHAMQSQLADSIRRLLRPTAASARDHALPR